MKRYLVMACLALTACTPTKLYLRADRSTFNVVEPEYRTYVELDGRLTSEQKARRNRLLNSWQKRLDAAQAGTER